MICSILGSFCGILPQASVKATFATEVGLIIDNHYLSLFLLWLLFIFIIITNIMLFLLLLLLALPLFPSLFSLFTIQSIRRSASNDAERNMVSSRTFSNLYFQIVSYRNISIFVQNYFAASSFSYFGFARLDYLKFVAVLSLPPSWRVLLIWLRLLLFV